MTRHTLFGYVEGFDLEDVAAELERRFHQFVEGRAWKSSGVWVVNQRQERDTSLRPGDLPQWNLGLNLSLPDVGAETPGWFRDVEAVALYLAELRAATGRNFVIGIHDNRAGFSEDLFTVDSEVPDLAQLGAILGAGRAA